MGKKTSKKILAVFMTLAMVMSFVPAMTLTASAAAGDMWIDQTATNSAATGGKTLLSVCYGNGIFVAVGAKYNNVSPYNTLEGAILTSSDGITWQKQLDTNNVAPQSVCSNGSGTFVAVGEDGTIWTSVNNGVNWTSQTKEGNYQRVCYGNGQFVAVIDHKVYTSSNGTSWTETGSIPGYYPIYGLCWNGSNAFVAVGFPDQDDSYAVQIYKSIDGNTWQERADSDIINNDYSCSNLNSVCYGSGKFVTVGDGGITATSLNNGDIWNLSTPVPYVQGLQSVCFGSSTFVAVGESGKIQASADGTTWITKDSNTGNILRGVCYGNNMFVAVGDNGTILTSGGVAVPTVTDANITIDGASGTVGAYKIGDTVTATWNNTVANGDNSADINSVTVDFSAFGGGSAVTATNTTQTWTASYTITSGSIDGTSKNVSITATNSSGGTKTTTDSTNATVDNQAPIVTAGNINISGASGTVGAYKIGDTVTATWKNTAGGDNNGDTMSSVTVDFSQFGGGAAVTAANSSGTWTATYTVALGVIDTTNRNVSVSATDNAGNTTTTVGTANATVDNQAPTVTDGCISISGGTGTGGAYKIGDTVTATWKSTTGGDSNSDIMSSVAVDFSQFGGGAAVAATNASGTWTATYTIVSGTIDATNRNVSVTATDNAGNSTTKTNSTNAVVDTIAPAVSISSLEPSTTKNSPIAVTITFTKSVSDFVVGDITVTNGTASNLNGSATTYTADITPANQGPVTVNVATGVAQDSAGIGNTAAAELKRTYDSKVPDAPTITTLPKTNNADSIMIDGTAEAETTITITGGAATASGTADGSGNYSISVNLTQNAVNTLVVKATDTAGNNSATASVAITEDSAVPTVSSINRQTPLDASTNAASVTFRVTFSESVMGVDASDITLTKTGSADGLIASVLPFSDLIYDVTVDTITGSGTLRLDLNSSGTGIKDSAENAIAAGYTSGQTYTVDTTIPTVTSVSVPANATYVSGQNLNFVVNFGESVTVNIGVETPRIALTIGSSPVVYASYVSGSGTSALVFRYTVVSGNTDSDGVTLGTSLDLNGGTIKDAAGNNATLTLNSVGSTTSVLVDATVPTVTSVGIPANATYVSGQDLDFTVNFGENVTVNTVGGTPSITLAIGSSTVYASYVSGSGTSALVFRYTVVSGNTDSDGVALGTSMDLNGGTIKDAAGNNATLTLNSVGSTTSVLVDAIVPSVSSINRQTPSEAATNASSVVFRVTFSESVTGVDASDFALTKTSLANGSIASVSPISGLIYDVTVNTVAGSGTLRLDLNSSGTSIIDATGNAIATGYTSGQTYTVDTTAPSVTITSAATSNTNTSPIPVTITFSESVTGFAVEDITVGNGTAGNFRDVNGTTYSADITPSGQGTVTVDVTASVAQDVAGNNNTVATQLSRTYDSIAPTLTITSTPSSSTNISPVPVTITFSENVTGFAIEDITAGNGTAGHFVAVSGTEYTATITPNGQGAVTVDVAANVAQDAAGNKNTAATQLSRIYDITAPTAGNSGAIAVSELTSSTAKLTWTAATDSGTLPANLQYKAIFSASNITSVEASDALSGTWTSSIATATVTGLAASTDYYFSVLVKDEAGNRALYSVATGKTTSAPSGGGGGGSTSTPASTSTVVEVNGQKQDAGTAKTQTTGGQTVTTITVDDTKLNKILETKGENPTVTLPTNMTSGVVVGELNGQTVKNMETKEATLEIKTGTVSYTLPATQINIDAVSSQIGTQVELKDIKVSVKISEPSADTVKVVEDTAKKNSYQIVVKPVEFKITCTSGNKTVEVSKFNGYVERTLAIPDGIDPAKITTGIVLNSDGTFRHVPTTIIKVDGKYYAKINSLTNSTYSVIWNPVTFTDVTNHWAKNAVNDMGSRMVVTGVGKSTYEPDRSITRAEFAAIVVRALGLAQGTKESSFGDVSQIEWFNGYVDTATAYALITGYDSKIFAPNDTITREQAMAILARAMKTTGLKVSLTDAEVSALLAKYEDGNAVSDYAKAGVATCLKSGVVTGSSATTLSPTAYVTRAEVAVMVQHLLQKSNLINK